MSRFIAAVLLLVCVVASSASASVVVRQGETTPPPTSTAMTGPTPPAGPTAPPSAGGSTPPTATGAGPVVTTTANATNTTSKNSSNESSTCFPADATVLTETGAIKRMDEIVAGDRVHVGRGQFSEVFMFTHKTAAIRSEFVVIDSAAGSRLRASPGHYIYANGALTAAKDVVVGDALELADGSVDTVAAVTMAAFDGLYNPQTLQGDIVVDGVRASTYTTAVEPVFAHAVLTPLRAVYRVLGLSTSLLNDGSSLVNSLPSGPAVC